FAQLFVGAVSGGSLAFRRQVWTTSGPYPSTSLREDADFLTAALQRDARLCRLPGRDLCIYVRHDRNTWRFAEGRHLDPAGWSR
ncbi:hypothetical protein, partial [Escherichia coli]|uniref:hypothetical protein n=1 Tax=Escherichia coli TaxID=562 RepID=UPI0019543623